MADHFIIFASDEQWSVGVQQDDHVLIETVESVAGKGLAEQVAAVRQAMTHLGYAEQAAAMAVPSQWCLSAVFSSEDLERGNRHRAMGFRIEEHLPMSAEDFVADYIELSGDTVLGVCCEYQRLREIVDAFDGAGIVIRHIVPKALLVASHVSEEVPDADAVLIANAPHPSGEECATHEAMASSNGTEDTVTYDFIQFGKGKPVRWLWLSDDEPSVRSQLASCASSNGKPTQVVQVGDLPRRSEYDAIEGVKRIELDGLSADEGAVRHAARVLQETSSPWVDLRRGPLAPPDRYEVYRKPLIAFAASVIALLLCVMAVTHYRGQQFDSMASEYQADQRNVFRRVLPNQHVPSTSRAIEMHLTRERGRLLALGGQSDGEGQTALILPESALTHLVNLLDSLPTSLRFRILELSIEPDLLRVDGEARSHVEAEQVATALRATGLYEVDPPRTQRLRDKGVSFAFSARPRSEPEKAGADG